ncbi:dTDP-4-dehydrorhamnose reductase [Flavisolibacter ginsenosidimutans]|uniref:dTDP-4-dehydrorhamnose reductase n=1 Tax=Flavisolibacter ginsenosidimutans TaxID=661481 RepID=A0A5B8UG92_9BACT|nr:dTDP-4-dehydrorhamnose reductase [Flavisolibacter ginsenosidimutans]QEC55614.1 dTDP-4-dehydrorhamnose reductase [Flavisolibacter ginsenosidimutans]
MADKQTILVTGSNGQLGSELKYLSAQFTAYNFVFLTRSELSLNDDHAIAKTIERHKPSFVINCAAYTAVDKAESEKEEAFQINAKAVGTLAKACAQYGIKFIHISTDYVFDGTRKTPLKEDDAVNPINVYGESKRAGEEAALQNNPAAIIIRTSWVYSFYGKNFVKTMMRLMNEKERINVVADQWGSPTYAADLAEAVLQIVQSPNWQPGIYHFSNEGVITWFDFAKEIAAQIHTNCVVQPTTTDSFPTPAKRPLYSVMSKEKVQKQYGIVLRDWKESLRRCVQKLSASVQ